MPKLKQLVDDFLATYDAGPLDKVGDITGKMAKLSPVGMLAGTKEGKAFTAKNRDWLEPVASTAGNLGGSLVGGAAVGGPTLGLGALAGSTAGGMAGEHLAKKTLGYDNEGHAEAVEDQPPPGHTEWLQQFEHLLASDPKLAALAQVNRSEEAGPVQHANTPQRSDMREAIKRGASGAGTAGGAALGWYAGRRAGEKLMPAGPGRYVGRLAGGLVGGVVGGFAGRQVGRDLGNHATTAAGYQYGLLDEE